MTRTRWMIAGLWFLALWLVAVFGIVPNLDHSLSLAADSAINGISTGYDKPKIYFDGQRAVVSGRVRREPDRAAIIAKLHRGLRMSSFLGSSLNPVVGVIDRLEVEPYPPGWLLIAANGSRGLLLGKAATNYEARDLALQIKQRWSDKGGYLDDRVRPDTDIYDEAPDVAGMLANLPFPKAESAGGDSAQIQIARIGGEWKRLIVDSKNEHLRESAEALGISAKDWEEAILPVIENARRYQTEQRQRIAEAERQSKLPPPHLFIAGRDRRLLVRGELATLTFKRELLNRLIESFPEFRIMDDLRVNAQRRAVAEFGPITEALLPPEKADDPKLAGKSLFLGLPGEAWKRVDFVVSGEAQPWRDLLPKDLPPILLADDSRMVIQWLHGSATGIPKLPVRLQPSFITITLLPDKVILSGQVAEEPSRTQIVAAARQKYHGRALVIADSFLARGSCEPSGDLMQTVLSLPDLPAPGSPGTLAFAKPGQICNSLTARETVTEVGAIAASGILPQDFPAAMAEDCFLDGFDHLRHYWKSLAAEAKKEHAP